MIPSNKRSAKRKYCSHCKEQLTIPVFKMRKPNFYDENKKEWRVEFPKYDDTRDLQDDDIIISG